MLLDWFTGGSAYNYMTAWHCMNNDVPWIYARFFSGVVLFGSYLGVTMYFFKRYLACKKTNLSRAMFMGSLVFLLCGTTHLIGACLETLWPAYRLEVIVRFVTAAACYVYVYYLHKIRFLEKLLNIDALRGR